MQKKNKFMDMALEIAFDNMGLTSPNPAVGAVIVKKDKILSTGGTGPYGSNHAEVNAIENAGCDLIGAEMYVTLEPCCHFGKTPPCTDAIIKAGIKKVHIPISDPNPEVAGKGIKKLQEAGVEVLIHKDMEENAFDLLRPFSKSILEKKTFIVNKSAISLDGKIATRTGDSKWISSESSRFVSHKLRAKVDAVIIGKNTFQNDSPLLNVRLKDFKDIGNNFSTNNKLNFLGRKNFFLKTLIQRDITKYKDPLRVILGLPGNFITRDKLFYDKNYLIFSDELEIDNFIKEQPVLSKKIDKLNIYVIKKKNIKNKIDIILDELYKQGIMFALLEGGGKISGAFLESDNIDQFLYFISPKVFGNGISAINNSGIENVTDCTELKEISALMLGPDIIYSAYK